MSMKNVDGVKYYTASEVSPMVGRSYSTIISWYEARDMASKNGLEFPGELPEIVRSFDKKRTRYWSEDSVEQLKLFRDNIQPGDLSYYNKRKMWGIRGQEILERQEKKEAEKVVEEEVSDKKEEA